MGLLTDELSAALDGSDPDAVVHALDTIFRTGSAGARERLAPFFTEERLSTSDGASRALRVLEVIFYRTRHFNEVTGPDADPGWAEALAPIAAHRRFFHMATLYLVAPHALDARLRLLELLRHPGVGEGGPSYGLLDALSRERDPRVAPAIASILGAPSADDWTVPHVLGKLDDPTTAPALRAYIPRMKRKKHRDHATEVLAKLERDREG